MDWNVSSIPCSSPAGRPSGWAVLTAEALDGAGPACNDDDSSRCGSRWPPAFAAGVGEPGRLASATSAEGVGASVVLAAVLSSVPRVVRMSLKRGRWPEAEADDDGVERMTIIASSSSSTPSSAVPDGSFVA